MISEFTNIKDNQHTWSDVRYKSIDPDGMHKYLESIPREFSNDYYLRLAIENVLSWSHEEILSATKLIQENDIDEICSVKLVKPIFLPEAYSHGTHNELLKYFAFDAYEALQNTFGSSDWGDWLLIPHYSLGDDSFEAVTLGVFICNNNQQVVE